jgi:hypothetical protein
MSKTSVFTTITPLPAGVTRQSVIDMYHNHEEMIDLNPLVIERFQCKPPSNAPAEEYYSTWYTIKGNNPYPISATEAAYLTPKEDKVSYLPGNLATGSVSYHASFHNLADGLQTHVYAPLGLDIRAKWSVGGNLPGEPKQPVELGLGAPREGLYIREDVKMKCNVLMISFVKKTFKESHSKLVDRLVEKAHEMEARVANERLQGLRNVDLRERMGHGEIVTAPPPGHGSPPPMQGAPAMSTRSGGSGNSYSPTSPPTPWQTSRRPSAYTGSVASDPRISTYTQDFGAGHRASSYGQDMRTKDRYELSQGEASGTYAYRAEELPVYGPAPVELPTEESKSKQERSFAAELPG